MLFVMFSKLNLAIEMLSLEDYVCHKIYNYTHWIENLDNNCLYATSLATHFTVLNLFNT